MEERRFDPAKLERLNNPERLIDLPLKFIWENLDMSDPKIIVDVGAGTGFYSIPFAQYYKNSKIYACDISEIMINWMINNVSNNNIIPLKMDEYNIPLQDNITDLVLMFNLYHEIEEPEKMLLECKRLLKPQTKIIIADWKKEQMESGPSIEIRCETSEVEKQLLNTGFENIKIFNDLKKHFVIIADN